MSDDLNVDLTADSGAGVPSTLAEEVLPTDPASPAPPPQKGGKKVGRTVAIVAVIAALVIGAGAFAVPAIIRLSNPKAAIVSALAKTMAQTGLTDAAAISAQLQGSRYQQQLSLRLGDQLPAALDDWGNKTLGLTADQLLGTGLSYTLESDRAARQMALTLGFDVGTYHAGDIQLFADNNVISLGSPELTDRQFYSFNTETLGADWTASPVFSELSTLDPALSFNLFDNPEGSTTPVLSPQTAAALTQASLDLEKATTVTREDKDYTLLVPADALQAYFHAVLQAVESDQTVAPLIAENMTTLKEYVALFQSDVTAHFVIDKGMVNKMEVVAPLGAEGRQAVVQFVMELSAEHALSFTLKVNEEIFLTTGLSVYADKAAKQVGIELPNMAITLSGETLALGVSTTLEPLDTFSFQPENATPLLELDQDSVLSLLFTAIGGLQTITQEMAAN